jgi:hypothetical protein
MARTYDVDTSEFAGRRFVNFQFDEGAPLLEQIAHAEALAARAVRISSTTALNFGAASAL